MIRILVAAALLASAVAVGAAGPLPDGKTLLAATLSDLRDKPTKLASLRGRPLVVNFWARWCGPCREEIPELAVRAARFKGKGLEVVGIAVEDKAEPVRDFARTYGMDYRILLAKDQGIALLQASGNPQAGLPFTLAFDRRGKVVFLKLGAMKPADMDDAFAAALK